MQTESVIEPNRNYLDIGVEQIKDESQGSDGDRKAIFGSGGAAEEAERVNDSTVEVMKEIRGEEEERFRIESMTTKGEEDECKPQSRTLHDEPSNRRRYGGTPSSTVVFAVGSLEEF